MDSSFLRHIGMPVKAKYCFIWAFAFTRGGTDIGTRKGIHPSPRMIGTVWSGISAWEREKRGFRVRESHEQTCICYGKGTLPFRSNFYTSLFCIWWHSGLAGW